MTSHAFDPQELRRMMIAQALLGASAGMAGAPNFLTGLARGAAGAGQGALAGRGDYANQWLLDYRMREAQAGSEDRERERAARELQDAALRGLLPKLPEDQRAGAQAFPKQFGEAWARNIFDETDDNIPSGYRRNATGGFEFTPGGPADPAIAGNLAAATRAPREPQQPSDDMQEYNFARQQGFPGSFLEFKNAQRGQGITIRDPETGEVIAQIGGGGTAMEKPTAARLEKEILDARGGLARLSKIESQFRPEFQQIGTRGAAWWSGLKAKAGIDLAPEDKQLLTDFAGYRRDSIDNINRHIKDLTGAQMSEHEAERIRKGMPDPGTGIFDGDDPVTFQAKLNATVRDMKMVAYRSMYTLQNGLDPLGTSLEEMSDVIEQRGNEIEAALAARGLSGDELDRAVGEQLMMEFGGT